MEHSYFPVSSPAPKTAAVGNSSPGRSSDERAINHPALVQARDKLYPFYTGYDHRRRIGVVTWPKFP